MKDSQEREGARDTQVHLTPEERKAVMGLVRLARRWPTSLSLSIRGEKLIVRKRGGEGGRLIYAPGMCEEGLVAEIAGMTSEGAGG